MCQKTIMNATSPPFDPGDPLGLLQPAELHPELQACIAEVPGLAFPVLRHPLYYAVPYVPALNGWINRGFAQRLETRARALAERNYHTFVFVHERPYRLEAFLEIEAALDDATYWPLLRDVHVDTENAHEYVSEWRRLWASSRACRELAMHDGERERLAAMPATLTVWHGVEHLGHDENVSWTLDRQTALWFARRYGKPSRQQRLARAQVAREDVLAYIASRNEEEIVVLPQALRGVRYEPAR